MLSGGSFSENIKDLLKGSSGFEEQPGTEAGQDHSCQVGPRAIGTSTRGDRPNFTSDVSRRMHDLDDVMPHDVHRSRSDAIRAVKSDADDDTDDDDSSLSSSSSH